MARTSFIFRQLRLYLKYLAKLSKPQGMCTSRGALLSPKVECPNKTSGGLTVASDDQFGSYIRESANFPKQCAVMYSCDWVFCVVDILFGPATVIG